MCVSVCKLVHFATMTGTQALLQEMKMSVRFSTGRRVNLMYPFPVPFHSMSGTQVPLEEMEVSVR